MLVYRLSYKYCGIREDAEDITQEIFAKLGRSILSFKGESSFKTWLYTLSVNMVKDHFRRNKRRLLETGFDESFEMESDDELQDEVLYKKQAIRAINALPEKLKGAIMLVCGEGLSHAEAAKVLKCSEGTVSWRLHEAKKQLAGIKEKIKLLFAWLF